MDGTRIVSILCMAALYTGGIAIPLIKFIRSWFDHGKWAKDACPSLAAEIVDVQSRRRDPRSNTCRFMTTVTFSDGYSFVTDVTDYEDTIQRHSLPPEGELLRQVLDYARENHEAAVRKLLDKGCSRRPVKEHWSAPKERKPLPRFLRPHYIAAVLGLAFSILINLWIPQEKLLYLTAPGAL